MTEGEAMAWVRERYGVPRETSLARLVELVRAEATRQNMVASSTLDSMWTRHVVDSAQLVPLAAGAAGGLWLDIGTGAGFPGLVVAALIDRPVMLVEPRAKRAAFLTQARDALGLANVRVTPTKVEAIREPAAVISARAVASLDSLLAAAAHCSTRSTVWVLPKGRSAREEVAHVRRAWHGVFHVEQSLTSPDSFVVVATGVARR